MYQIVMTTGAIIAEVEDVRYVKWRDDFKCWVRTRNMDDAQCVAVDGTRYSLLGKEPVEDAPVIVYVREVDAATAHFQTQKQLNITERDLQDIAWGMQKMAAEIVDMLNVAAEIVDVATEVSDITKE